MRPKQAIPEGVSSTVLAFLIVVSVLSAGAAGLAAAQAGDQFEPNDNVDQAAQIDRGSYDSLSIHSSSDVDIYVVDVQQGEEVTVDLEFSHANGDVDVRLYDPNQNQVGISQSITDGEHISYTAQTSGTHYVVVYGYLGATNSYSMTVGPQSGLLGGNLPLILGGAALVAVGYFVFVKD